MKTKKWLFVVIALLLIVGVGGKVFMDKQKKQEMKEQQEIETNKIEAERMSVVALKETFADIKSVEFEKSVYNEMTGSYSFHIKMTNSFNKSVSFTYSFWLESREIGGYGIEDKEVQSEGVTTNMVRVIYSNKDEGEV